MIDESNPYRESWSRVSELDPDDVERKRPALANPKVNATEVRCMRQYYRLIKVELRVRRAEQRRLARYLRRAQRCGNNLACRGRWDEV